MFKRKFVLILCVVMILSMILTACGKTESQSTEKEQANGSDNADEKIVIKVAHVLAESHFTHITLRDSFKKHVEDKTNGRISVEIYPNAQLGSDRQTIEAVQLGTLEMCCPAAAVLTGFNPKFQVLDLPFLFKDKAAAYKALDGELGQTLSKELLNSAGIRSFCYGENGFRNITNNKGPITKPEDLQGVKIRTMESPVHMASFKAIGANPTPIAFGELYTALQQKTVDAQENPIPIIFTSKFYEVQKYLTLSGHFYASCPLLINEKFFKSLSEGDQKVLEEAALAWLDDQRNYSEKQTDEMIKELEKEMEVNELTAEQKDAFIKAVRPVYDEYRDQIGGELVDLAIKANE